MRNPEKGFHPKECWQLRNFLTPSFQRAEFDYNLPISKLNLMALLPRLKLHVIAAIAVALAFFVAVEAVVKAQEELACTPLEF